MQQEDARVSRFALEGTMSRMLNTSDTAVVIVVGVSDGPASEFACSICSAMSICSCCSSDVVKCSFLRAAS